MCACVCACACACRRARDCERACCERSTEGDVREQVCLKTKAHLFTAVLYPHYTLHLFTLLTLQLPPSFTDSLPLIISGDTFIQGVICNTLLPSFILNMSCRLSALMLICLHAKLNRHHALNDGRFGILNEKSPTQCRRAWSQIMSE